MPGPRFVVCSVCRRQILPHSLDVHESKCWERWCMDSNNSKSIMGINLNGKRSISLNSRQKSNISNKSPILDRSAFRWIGNKPKSNSVQKIDQKLQKSNSTDGNLKRPGTVTISPIGRNLNNDTKTALCYICGQQYNLNTVEVHERKCLHAWTCLVAKLPPAIRVYKPEKLRYPSLDGTVDTTRLDCWAKQSSEKSQKVDCSRCRKTGIDLVQAREHVRQCGTKKPEIPPKNKNGNTNGAGFKAKKKKNGEKEIFVSIFA